MAQFFRDKYNLTPRKALNQPYLAKRLINTYFSSRSEYEIQSAKRVYEESYKYRLMLSDTERSRSRKAVSVYQTPKQGGVLELISAV